jgi:hypothetical protein
VKGFAKAGRGTVEERAGLGRRRRINFPALIEVWILVLGIYLSTHVRLLSGRGEGPGQRVENSLGIIVS